MAGGRVFDKSHFCGDNGRAFDHALRVLSRFRFHHRVMFLAEA
jgi:hypothetical protein